MSSEYLNEAMQLINDFDRQADEIVNSFAQKIDEEPPPSIIYHYTDGAGLRGILESGALWFTDIFNLNDPTELRHGMNPAVEIMKRRAEEEEGKPWVKAVSEIFLNIQQHRVDQIAHYFVCCFSKDGDDLGQWRAYADNGRGYAIGFDGPFFVQAFEESMSDNIFHWAFPITYKDDDLWNMSEKIIDKFITLHSLLCEKRFNWDELMTFLLPLLSTRCMGNILRAALLFKHDAYKNEQEYRFLQVHQAGTSAGVKYREFDWRTVAARSLKKIIIGPAADRNLAHQFAEDCLRAFSSFDGVEIGQSDIPYRAL